MILRLTCLTATLAALSSAASAVTLTDADLKTYSDAFLTAVAQEAQATCLNRTPDISPEDLKTCMTLNTKGAIAAGYGFFLQKNYAIPYYDASLGKCTASTLVCDAYQQYTGRLPDVSGARFWQGRVDALTAAGKTTDEIKNQLKLEMAGTSEVQSFTTGGVMQANTVASGLSGANTTGFCTNATDCSADTFSKTSAEDDTPVGGIQTR